MKNTTISLYKIINILLFTLFFIRCFSQAESPSPKLIFQHLRTDDGLSQNYNNFVFKDSRGFVWISSISGLNRFDGYHVKIYRESIGDSTSIKGQNINGFFSEDKTGNLWFSTYNAINCYIRNQDNFRSYVLKDDFGEVLTGYFTCGLDGEGNLWFIHDAELYKFNIINKHFSFVANIIHGAHRGKIETGKEERVKRVYIYTTDAKSGIQVISFETNNKITSKIYFSKSLEDIGSPLQVFNVFPENDTLIWIASSTGLVAFNHVEETYDCFQKTITENNKEIQIGFRGIVSLDNNLLLSSTGHGITFFDKTKHQFSKFVKNNRANIYSPISNWALGIYKDFDNDLWIGYSGKGLDYAKYNDIKFSTALSDNELTKGVSIGRMFQASNEQIFASAFTTGIYVLDQNLGIVDTISSSNYENWKSNDLAYMFEDSSNRLWLLGWSELAYYDILTKQVISVSREVEEQERVFIFGKKTADGKILLCSRSGGIFEVQDDKNNTLNIKKLAQVRSDIAYPIFFQSREGLIYANGNLSQMVVFDENLNQIKTIPIEADFKCFYEPPNDSILWIGTDRGLVRYNKLNDKFAFFAEKEGLPNAMVFGIISDKNSHLWLSTSGGLAKFHQLNFSVESYNRLDGIGLTTFNAFSFLEKSDGQILFGSNNGLTTFYPDEIIPTPYLVHPQITAIKINDDFLPNLKCSETDATNFSEIKSLDLDYENNTISLEFSAMDYGDSKNNRYRYQMLGEDEGWIESGTRNFVRYSNLSPQKYEFKLLAANSDNNWSQNPIILKINIVPPIWKRTWFLLLALGILIWLTWLGFRIHFEYKFGKKLALEKQKLFWARKMHEDLGADYSSLRLRIGIMIGNLKQGVFEEKESTRIESLANNVAKQIRGITWSLNYKNDTIEKLLNYLQDYAIKLFEDTSIDLRFPIPDKIPINKISGEARMTVLHVFKESLNNIQKYSQANEVCISIQKFPSQIEIFVEDNGVGFNPILLTHSTGDGLNNMRERMIEIKGRCEIKTDSSGTSVLIAFPI